MALETSKTEELVVGLYDRQALLFGDFKWKIKSGQHSPFYYNQRKITSFDTASDLTIDAQRRIRDLAIKAYSAGIDDLGKEYEHLYGIPLSLTALGSMVAQVRGDSILWGRAGDKTYGVHTPIEGDFNEGDRVVSLDDVVSSAASKIETAESLQEAKLEPQGFVIMFDREEGGAERVREAGYDLIAVTGLAYAMDMLRNAGKIGSKEYDWIEQYHEHLQADKA